MSDPSSIEIRPSRRVVKVFGKDAVHLLGDVLTGHIAAEPGPARWWALLTPQGKILAEGLCGFFEDALWLDLDESVIDNFLKRMRMYKLRADVTIEDTSQSHAVGWSPIAVDDGNCAMDGRGEALGFRIIAPREQAADWSTGDGWLACRAGFGLAELGPDFAAETSFPHDIAMDLLGGIDFDKGCYVGQEVVSRMKHRGTARRRPVIVSGAAVAVGLPVLAGEREAGTLGAVADGHGVAVLRLDRITAGVDVTVGGAPASLALPSWAVYGFGDSGGSD